MNSVLTLPLALSAGQTDRISGAALAAALLVLAVCLALALARWNDDDDSRPGYVEIPPAVEDDRADATQHSMKEWQAASRASEARSRERRQSR